MKQHILLLEDDPNLGFMLQEHLEANGFKVTLKIDGEAASLFLEGGHADLCLVDVMMPKKDGFAFARELRAADAQTPIIFLTAKSLKEDRIEGFKLGGDDYITKPFSMEELLLRIQAVLKRTSGGGAETASRGMIRIGKYTFDSGRQILSWKTGSQALTSKESQLLQMLAAHKNSIVLRSDILKAVWGDDTIYNSRSLDVFISKLRKYIAADAGLDIKNIHGRGYRLTSSI
jgi:DNA-binding response OmpR family regulator